MALGRSAGGASAGGEAGFLALVRAGDLRGLLARHSDLALAGLVVSIVGMMIIPLPTSVLDLLISLNIAVAVTLLLISIYVSDVLRIATFPTLLLLTTLFRLALEISATRLILLHANAGEVIHAFGAVVVAGNLVVGGVIFFILTIVQFIVISKGAERVAEVAARFTLDAMPGKQMSIDAELRGGHIDHREARRRRATLTRESQLFGAMDGAMKFVKGDAIAGLIILAANIIGGLIIGIVQRGMDAGAAARTFTVLTIGEGLVSQIPALVISTAAGIIVTRVASEEEGAHLGKEIAIQIIGQPKAIAIAAGLLALLALVPGLPLVPFLALAALLGFAARTLLRQQPAAAMSGRDRRTRGGEPTSARLVGDSGARGEASADALPPPLLTAITVELGGDLGGELCPEGDCGSCAERLVATVGPRLFAELGVQLPVLSVQLGAAEAPAAGYVLRLNEVPLARVDTVSRATALGPTVVDPEELIGAHVLALMHRYGHELIGIEEAQVLLERLERTHPALVREVVPKLVSPALLADVLRRLVEEGVSLRNLKDVLGALAQWAPDERDPVTLTERVRAVLRRAITYRHTSPDGVLPVFLLDPVIEDAVRDAIHKTSTGSYLALEPQLSRDIVEAVGRAVAPPEEPAGPARAPVILTSADIRRYVRRLVETEHPHLAVLAYPELAPEVRLEQLGRISVA